MNKINSKKIFLGVAIFAFFLLVVGMIVGAWASYIPNVLGSKTKVATTTMSMIGIYPDPKITPGVLNPDVTEDNIKTTICVSGWTKTIRPPSSYTSKLKIQQIKQYGYADKNPSHYEEDHLVSLVLGGSPTDPKNLWPEPYELIIPNVGARSKDVVENYLHREVCAGRMSLLLAQRLIVNNWYDVYHSVFRNKFGATTIGLDQDDD